MQLTVAIAQIDLALGDRAANLEQARQAASAAASAGAGLLVLPELWGSGYDLERAAELSDRSEERRVGKECRSRWSPYHEKKNMRLTYKLFESRTGVDSLHNRALIVELRDRIDLLYH